MKKGTQAICMQRDGRMVGKVGGATDTLWQLAKPMRPLSGLAGFVYRAEAMQVPAQPRDGIAHIAAQEAGV